MQQIGLFALVIQINRYDFCLQQMGFPSFGGEDGNSEESNTYQAMMQVCHHSCISHSTRRDAHLVHEFISHSNRHQLMVDTSLA